jgi:hypothetical protein
LEPANATQRAALRIEVDASEGHVVDRTARMLTRLTAIDLGVAQRVSERGKLSLVGNLSAPEQEILESALTALGLRFSQVTRFVVAESSSVRLALDARSLIQLGVVILGFVLALYFDVRWLSFLSVPVAAVLVLATLERIPHTLTISSSIADEKLGAVDRAVWQALVTVRRGIKSSEALEVATRCSAILTTVVEQLRKDGLHLTRTDFALLDQDAHALFRRSMSLAAAADRVSLAAEQTPEPGPRKARLLSARQEMFAALALVERKLHALYASLVEFRGLDASNEALLGATSRVTELQVTVETALELNSVFAESREVSSHRLPGDLR